MRGFLSGAIMGLTTNTDWLKPRSDWRAISFKLDACVSFFNGCCTHFAACVPSKNKKLTPNARQSERSFRVITQVRPAHCSVHGPTHCSNSLHCDWLTAHLRQWAEPWACCLACIGKIIKFCTYDSSIIFWAKSDVRKVATFENVLFNAFVVALPKFLSFVPLKIALRILSPKWPFWWSWYVHRMQTKTTVTSRNLHMANHRRKSYPQNT